MENNNFHDIWQGISPGLIPLPQAVTNFSQSDVSPKPDIQSPEIPAPQLPSEDRFETSAPENEVLSDILIYETITMEFLRELYRKSPKHIVRMLSEVIDAQKAGLKKVSAVYFIKTGRGIPEQKSCPYIPSIPYALRNLYLDEYNRLSKYRALSDSTEDLQLRSLYNYLSEIKEISITSIEKMLAILIR